MCLFCKNVASALPVYTSRHLIDPTLTFFAAYPVQADELQHEYTNYPVISLSQMDTLR
jgi:hypothetical protein